MNPKLLELAMRHGALKARIDEQRRQLARHAEPLQGALAKGDSVLKGVDWLKHHPAAVGVAVTVAVIARPKRAFRWARRSFFLWRGWRAIKSTLAGIR
jgi:hypothetical protein